MTMVIFVGVASESIAQGRGNHYGKKDKHEHHDKKGHHDDRHHDWKHDRDHYKHDKHDRHKYSRHGHHHADRHVAYRRAYGHHHAPVVVKHYHERPRYIYYRDYDVYYDHHRDVYISWSGRNWSVSANLPVVLHRVDRAHAVRMEVDYERDDFAVYLQSNRPAYRRIYTEF